MVEISLSGSGEGLGRVIARGYSTSGSGMTDPQFSIPIDFVADLNAKRGASLPIEREHEDLFPIVPEHWRFVLTSDRDRMRQVEA